MKITYAKKPEIVIGRAFSGVLAGGPRGACMIKDDGAARRIPAAFPLVLVLVFLLAGCPDDRGQRAAARPPQVVVMEAAPQRVVLSTELPGRVSAYRRAEVRPQVGGILKDRLFVEGSAVEAGQALYKIDPATYEAALDSAKAALAKAEARLAPARLKVNRYRSLFGIKAVSRQELEDAQTSFDEAKADVAVCRVAVRTASIHLAYTDVTAPIAGRIGKSSVTQGALVTANQAAPLAVIQQLDPVYVDVTQSSLDLLRLRERLASGRLSHAGEARAAVRLRLENGSEYPLDGALQFADITVDESTGMVSLRAVFPNPDGVLLPGMYVRARLNEGVDEKALLVPQLAVARDARGQASVFVVGADGKAERRAVEATEMAGNCWNVTAGLSPGDKVVIEGFQKLRHGMPVQVSGEKTIAQVRR